MLCNPIPYCNYSHTFSLQSTMSTDKSFHYNTIHIHYEQKVQEKQKCQPGQPNMYLHLLHGFKHTELVNTGKVHFIDNNTFTQIVSHCKIEY